MTIHAFARICAGICALVCVGALGACGGGNPVKDLAQAAGVGGEPKPSPDFVTRTRKTGYEYMPVGESAPKRPLKAKNATGVAGAEADLEASRAGNESRATLAREAGAKVKPITQ
jgi:hypothetical protein